jgi:anti-sigma B factor antagonist
VGYDPAARGAPVPDITKRLVEPDVTVVEVSGRIALGRECQVVEWTVEELLRSNRKKMVFDLSRLDYVDSTGLGILVMCVGKVDAAGGELRLASLQPRVENLMRISKLHRIMTFYPDVTTALEGFAAQP